MCETDFIFGHTHSTLAMQEGESMVIVHPVEYRETTTIQFSLLATAQQTTVIFHALPKPAVWEV